MSWTRTLKTTTHTFIFHKIALLTNQTNQGRPTAYKPVCPLYDFPYQLQSWTKVLGHFSISRAFSNSHRSNPSPHPTNKVGRVYPEFFPSFNFV